MLESIKEKANIKSTENGARTYESSGSHCLDLFATIGALRKADDEEINSRFVRAYFENPDLAMKILFFARDIRGGLGERRVFRVALNWLAKNEPESVIKNLKYIAEFGRYDDLLSLMETPCEYEMIMFIKHQLEKDLDAAENGDAVSLLAKWLPSVNTSNIDTKRFGKKLAKSLGLSEKEYRKALSLLRSRIQIIENNLREKDYTFDYEKQPSNALLKYKEAFLRYDNERYSAFIADVCAGKKKLNAANIAPYELVKQYIANRSIWGIKDDSFLDILSSEQKSVINATWDSIPDYCNGENALAVIDTSGSMYSSLYQVPPASVALSLGIYLAERNKGCFKNHFIMFSKRPQLIELKGETFIDKLRYAVSFNEIANTNLESVFDLILGAALEHNAAQEELPAKLIIVSDMEFDSCVDNASAVNLENANAKFKAAGYKLPQVVFWNVASRNRQQPVRQNEAGVALVSGVTPRIFSMVAGDLISPYELMMETLGNKRYNSIAA